MADDRELHLRDYIHVVRKRRVSAALFFVVFFLAVAVYTFTATPEYSASTKLLIERVEPYSVDNNSNSVKLQPDVNFYETQYQLIKSKPVSLKVFDALIGNAAFSSYYKNMRPPLYARVIAEISATIKRYTGGGADTEASDGITPEQKWKNDVIESMIESIKVSPLKDTRIVNVQFKATDREVSRIVANNVAKAYIEALMDLRVSATQISLQWMSQQVEEERKKLDVSEKALQDYMQQNDIVTLEDRLTITPQKLSEISTELTKAETRRKELETLYEKARAVKNLDAADSIPKVSSDPMVGAIKTELFKAESAMDELSKKYGLKHPAMIEAQSQLRSLQEKKRVEVRRVLDTIKNEYELALSNERGLRAALESTKQDALALNERFIRYSAMKREVDTGRQIFDTLLKRMREQSLNEEGQAVNVVILEPAELPKSPAHPKKALNLILGMILGVMGGVGMAFFMEYFDNTVRTPEEAEERLGAPVLGMVSLYHGDDVDSHGIETIVNDDPKSTFSENFKALRTSIMLSSAEKPPQCLLVTSTGPEEGKTSMSINLALVMAQSDKKVLLMDCDLRKPRVHRVFGMGNQSGVSTFVAGEGSPIVQPGPTANMKIITSGPIPPNPSELLSAARFNSLIEAVRRQFDIIIIDSPPILSVTDALILSRVADGTVVVARAGSTTYEFASKGLKLLGDVKAHVLGLLINAVDISKSEYYYYRYQGYYYADQEQGSRKLAASGARRRENGSGD